MLMLYVIIHSSRTDWRKGRSAVYTASSPAAAMRCEPSAARLARNSASKRTAKMFTRRNTLCWVACIRRGGVKGSGCKLTFQECACCSSSCVSPLCLYSVSFCASVTLCLRLSLLSFCVSLSVSLRVHLGLLCLCLFFLLCSCVPQYGACLAP